MRKLSFIATGCVIFFLSVYSLAFCLEKTVSEIFQQVSPAVVLIIAHTPKGVGQGSGFIVESDGLVVTNFHVVAGAEEIEVRLKNGKSYPVEEIISYDLKRDICLLKIGAHDLPVATLGDSDKIEAAQKVCVIGAPLGLEFTVTDGLCSGIREEFGRKSIQFSAPISPGNSGGPLLNTSGEIIGITTFLIQGGQNLNFAVPVNDVHRLLENRHNGKSIKEFAATVSKAYTFYNLSLEAYHAKNYDAMFNYVTEAIRLDPSFLDAQVLLGEIFSALGRVDEEYAQWNKVLELDPHNIEAHNNLGVIYANQGSYDKALEKYQHALAIDPRDAMAYSNICAVYDRQGRVDEAIGACKKAVEFDPGYSTAHGNLGWGYYEKGLEEEAIKETQRALILNPYNGQANFNLSWIYLQKGQYELAAEYCDKAIESGFEVGEDYLVKLGPYRKSKPPLFAETGSAATGLTDDEAMVLNDADAETTNLLTSANEALNKNNPDSAVQYLKIALKRVPKGCRLYKVIIKMLDITYQKYKK